MSVRSINLASKQFKELAQKIKDLATPLEKREAQKIGDEVVSDMKTLISKGENPIDGKGPFAPYKHPEKYPGKRKPHSPVNLELTGRMLANLKAKALSGTEIEVGYRDPKQAEKEKGHRQGANSQPKRPTIPKGREQFHKSIMQKIKELTLKKIRKIIR